MPEFLQSGNPQLARNIIDNELSNVEVMPQEEQAVQVDAGYDDDCCNQIRQHVLQAWNEHNARHTMDVVSVPNDKDGKPIFDFEAYMERIPCEEVLETFGLWELFNQGETLQDVYNECVAGKTPAGEPDSGGIYTTGEPMDLAWRLLKNV